MIRIREVGIGSYDKTLLNFSQSAGPIITGMTGEIYVDEGLENALNIDRNSFRETDQHYLAFQEAVYKKLTESKDKGGVLQDARGRSQLVNRKKRDVRNDTDLKRLTEAVNKATGRTFTLERSSEARDRPVLIDSARARIVIYWSPLLPKKSDQRWALEKLLIFYELSTLNHLSKDSMDKLFYSLIERGY
ncbi:hypothetical protein MUP77_23130 [Candidatus Bathyarchaeota archaeon]|nr:hypothetical protein [Candidatus Bathyarchaeota archaeon]